MNINLNQIIENVKRSLIRFPFAIALAVFGSIIGMLLVDCADESREHLLANLLIVSLVWFTPLISLQLLAEALQLKALKKYLLMLVPIGLMLVHFWLMPEDFDSIRFFVQAAILGLSLHLGVSFFAFFKNQSNLNFWQFNQTLFIQFIIAVFFSQVLYAGLSLSLLSVEHLFNVDVNSDWYAYLFISIAGVFNTWYFLSQIPEAFEMEDKKIVISKFLNVFTKYILLPIVLIYLIILYLYIGRIVILQEWPKGWVANLVISYSAVGIFTFLLSYPLFHKAKELWAKRLPNLFFLSLFPLIVVLCLSIYIRIDEYGITENRYYVVLIAIWLAGISAYMLIKKFDAIKYIPLSLSFILILTAFGPWSSFSISKVSQQNRFETLLNKYDALQDGKIKPIQDTVAFKDRQSMSSIVEYLYEYHDVESLNGYFEDDLTLLDTNAYSRSNYTQIVSLIGFDYVSRWEMNPSTNDHFSFHKNYQKNTVLNLSKPDYFLKYNSYAYNDEASVQEYLINDTLLVINHTQTKLNISYGDVSKDVDLQDYIQKFYPMHKSSQNIDSEDFKLKVELDNIDLLFYFGSMTGNKKEDTLVVQNIDADLFVSLKE